MDFITPEKEPSNMEDEEMKKEEKEEKIEGVSKGYLILKDIPPEVHRDFKAVCGEKGYTMKDKLIELMRKEGKKKNEN